MLEENKLLSIVFLPQSVKMVGFSVEVIKFCLIFLSLFIPTIAKVQENRSNLKNQVESLQSLVKNVVSELMDLRQRHRKMENKYNRLSNEFRSLRYKQDRDILTEAIDSAVPIRQSVHPRFLQNRDAVPTVQDRDLCTCPKGDTGEIGPPGPDGRRGYNGRDGQKGDRGLKGDPGIPGFNGDDGLDGEKGEPGLKGDSGASGLQGPKGAAGSTGTQGQKGDIGTIGPQGPKGDTGSTGPTGPKGISGTNGQQGPKGNSGQQGVPGETGIAGPPGQKGEPCQNEVATNIAFTASNGHDKQLQHNRIIIYGTEDTNIGSSYDKATGLFTCTKAGVYMFSWSIDVVSRHRYIKSELRVNGRSRANLEVTGGDHPNTGSNIFILHLSPNDEVGIYPVTFTSGSMLGKSSRFSGYLLHA